MSNTRWLSVDEWRNQYNLSRTTAYALLQSGQVPAVRIGRTWRVSLELWEESLLAQARARLESAPAGLASSLR